MGLHKLHSRSYDFTGTSVVILIVKSMYPLRMVHDFQVDVAAQGLSDEPVQSWLQIGNLVLSRARHKDRRYFRGVVTELDQGREFFQLRFGQKLLMHR